MATTVPPGPHTHLLKPAFQRPLCAPSTQGPCNHWANHLAPGGPNHFSAGARMRQWPLRPRSQAESERGPAVRDTPPALAASELRLGSFAQAVGPEFHPIFSNAKHPHPPPASY